MGGGFAIEHAGKPPRAEPGRGGSAGLARTRGGLGSPRPQGEGSIPGPGSGGAPAPAASQSGVGSAQLLFQTRFASHPRARREMKPADWSPNYAPGRNQTIPSPVVGHWCCSSLERGREGWYLGNDPSDTHGSPKPRSASPGRLARHHAGLIRVHDPILAPAFAR